MNKGRLNFRTCKNRRVTYPGVGLLVNDAIAGVWEDEKRLGKENLEGFGNIPSLKPITSL